MIIAAYVSNIAIAAWNLLRATASVYRPNNDGWVHSWWYCLDCLGNAALGGDPLETISSRAGKARVAGRRWGCILCFLLGYVATVIAGKLVDHCALSVNKKAGSRAIIPDGE